MKGVNPVSASGSLLVTFDLGGPVRRSPHWPSDHVKQSLITKIHKKENPLMGKNGEISLRCCVTCEGMVALSTPLSSSTSVPSTTHTLKVSVIHWPWLKPELHLKHTKGESHCYQKSLKPASRSVGSTLKCWQFHLSITS